MSKSLTRRVRTGCLVSLLVGIAGVISGCAGNLMPYTSDVRNALPEDAVVMPPAGGPSIVSVIETQYSNALNQRILLETKARTPGQNYIDASFYGTKNYSPMNGRRLAYRSIVSSNMVREAREELPGVALSQSPYYVQNNYGPFGYAFGRGRGNDLCMYGWQQIRPDRGSFSGAMNRGNIQIRVRFCEAGASEDALLGIMYGYVINAAIDAYGWNPYGYQNAPPEMLGRSGAPTYPTKAYDDRDDQLANSQGVLKTSAAPAPSTRQATAPARAAVAGDTADRINVQVMNVPLDSLPVTGAPAVSPAPSFAAVPATTLPVPTRQTPAAPVQTNAAPQSAPAAAGRIPAPPCRLLPGSTTVSCE